MKLTKSQLKKCPYEAIICHGQTRRWLNASEDEQNKTLSDLMYEYVEKVCQAPAD